jgi:hypothetical protein
MVYTHLNAYSVSISTKKSISTFIKKPIKNKKMKLMDNIKTFIIKLIYRKIKSLMKNN